MRKKSHISLARYIVNSNGFEGLEGHKKAFYFGSILPDCVPSFITRKHTINETFDILKEEIRKITEDYDISKGISGYYCRHLGVVTHYIADYFTYPHNEIFRGNLKEHCVYESELKDVMKEYVDSREAKRIREKTGKFRTVDEICKFIEKMHQEYLKAMKEVKADCHYIVELCHKVVDAILQVFELQFKNLSSQQAAIA